MKSVVFLIGIFWTISSVIGPLMKDGDTTEVVEVIEWNREKYTPQENQRYPALILWDDDLKITEKISTEHEEAFACPPRNEDETLPNSQECITKNCLVIKKTVPKGERESEKICTHQYAPSMIWNITTSSVEIGYEFRFLETKFIRNIFLRDSEDTSKAFAGIIDNVIPQPLGHGKEKKSKNIRVDLKNSHTYSKTNYPLGKHFNKLLQRVKKPRFDLTPYSNSVETPYSFQRFIWKSVLQIQFDTELNIARQVRFQIPWYDTVTTEGECSNYTIIEGLTYQIQDLDKYYLPENQSEMLAGLEPFLTLENFFSRTEGREIPKTSNNCGLPCGCLVQKQLVPHFYYGLRAYKQATCTQLNTVPIWESVAGKTWRRLENFLLSFSNYKTGVQIITGTAGILQLPITNSSEGRNIFMNFEKKTIAVPKLVYKLVTYTTKDLRHRNDYNYAMVIVIHNDPTLLVWDSRVCEKSVCAEYGWEEIENKDYQTGLIYCCKPSVEVMNKLAMRSVDVSSHTSYAPFGLNSFEEYSKYDWGMVTMKFEIESSGNDKYSFKEIKKKNDED